MRRECCEEVEQRLAYEDTEVGGCEDLISE